MELFPNLGIRPVVVNVLSGSCGMTPLLVSCTMSLQLSLGTLVYFFARHFVVSTQKEGRAVEK